MEVEDKGAACGGSQQRWESRFVVGFVIRLEVHADCAAIELVQAVVKECLAGEKPLGKAVAVVAIGDWGRVCDAEFEGRVPV